MTDEINGVIQEARNWSNGKGCDLILVDDEEKYFFNGKLTFPVGRACIFEVVDGEGDRKGQYEVISFREPVVNPEIPKPPMGPHTGPQDGIVQLPLSQFKGILEMKSALADSRVKSLDMATRVYAAMCRVEKDPKAAANDVVIIAQILEAHLI